MTRAVIRGRRPDLRAFPPRAFRGRRIKPPMEWVKVNRHLQTWGTATSDVADLILTADDLVREGHTDAAERVMYAARRVSQYQQRMAGLLAARARN